MNQRVATKLALTDMLPSARRKYGAGVQLRELPDGRRQVVRYPLRDSLVARDSSGTEVVAETSGPWSALGVHL